MLQKLKLSQLIINEVRAFLIEGEILKVIVRSKKDLSHVKLHIETEDNELIYSGYITPKLCIYPKNISVVNNVVCTNNIILMGRLYFKWEGLEEGDVIDSIEVIIDKAPENRHTG